MLHSDLPRRVGSPAHTRSILRDFHLEWVERERVRLELQRDLKEAAMLLALTLHERNNDDQAGRV